MRGTASLLPGLVVLAFALAPAPQQSETTSELASAPPRAEPAIADTPGENETLARLMSDPAFEDMLSLSFEVILSDEELMVYSACDEAGRRVFRKRFWTMNDPTPATAANEFLEEHLRRLCYALENFCVAGDVTWDDRGDMALRFGPPAHRSSQMGDFSLAPGARGLIPNSETWFYPRMDMSISFFDPNLDQRYEVGADIKHFSVRPPPAPIIDVWESPDEYGGAIPYLPTPVATPIEMMHAVAVAKRKADKGWNAVEEVPVSYGFAPPAEPLPLFYEIVTARSSRHLTDVAINFQVPRSCLAFVKDGDGASSTLRKQVRVLTTDYEVVMAADRRLTVLSAGDGRATETAEWGPDAATDSEALLTDEWRLDAPPADYIIEFCVEDTITGRRGFGRSNVKVPGYGSRRLSMSDIQLARAVATGERFGRMGGSVIPHPIHAFSQSDEMIIYFELYGLTEDRPDVSRFTVSTEIVSHNYKPDGNWVSRFFSRLVPTERYSISSKVIGWGEVPDSAYWYALSLANLAEDNYDLVITIKDARSGQQVSKMVAFTVLEP